VSTVYCGPCFPCAFFFLRPPEDDDDCSRWRSRGTGCLGVDGSGSLSQFIFACGCRVSSDSSGSTRRLSTFRYRCSAPTYSLTLRSSARDVSRRVFDSRRLRSVFATAEVGLRNRLYSLSNSSSRTNFLAACISSVGADYPIRTGSAAVWR